MPAPTVHPALDLSRARDRWDRLVEQATGLERGTPGHTATSVALRLPHELTEGHVPWSPQLQRRSTAVELVRAVNRALDPYPRAPLESAERRERLMRALMLQRQVLNRLEGRRVNRQETERATKIPVRVSTEAPAEIYRRAGLGARALTRRREEHAR